MLGGHGLSAKDNAIIAVAGPLVHAPLVRRPFGLR